MRVITLECSNCGTVIAANELEDSRIMKCPTIDCESVLRFSDLPEDDRLFYLNNKEQYRI